MITYLRNAGMSGGGEVESYEWRTLDDFKAIALDPEAHDLINQGRLYFDSLVSSVEYVSTGKMHYFSLLIGV